MNAPAMLERLQEWYIARCDGDWEHDNGIRIETVDNPGWAVTVDLSDTHLAELSFPEVIFSSGSADWYRCRVEGGVFRGAGGPRALEAIVGAFLDWAESSG